MTQQSMPDWGVMTLEDLRITSIAPMEPVTRSSILHRLQLTAAATASALLFVPALLLLILTVVSWPLVLVGVGLLLISLAVPGTELLTRAHRTLSGALLGEAISAEYADDRGASAVGRPLVWLRDPFRWREFGFLAFSVSGGALLSALPMMLLASPVLYLVLAVLDGGMVWILLLFLGGPMLVVWWLVTPALVRARALADRGILGGSRTEGLQRRVRQVTESRADTVDHSAAEIRRIERDLHDGAQARIVSVGMNLGLAEEMMGSDPEAAATLLREARESTVTALSDLRTVVRGIHPPVLADRGLTGAVEALALDLPIPVTLTVALQGRLPAPVETALYFAVAECLANTVKHAHASRAWISLSHSAGLAHVEVGDDGNGGADPASSGLAGVARRLGAFDGTMAVDSPQGGPTVVTMEVPCSQNDPSAASSPRTSPS